MNIDAVKQPSAIIPIVMSAAAIATVLVHLLIFGAAPQADEGASAHLWQLLMAGQAPVIIFYSIKWLPQTPRTALAVVAVQIGAALAAAGPVYWLGW